MVNVTDDRIDVLKSFYVKRDELQRRLEFWQLNIDRLELELGLAVMVNLYGTHKVTGNHICETLLITRHEYECQRDNVLRHWIESRFGANGTDAGIDVLEIHEQTAHYCPHCFSVMPIDETCKSEHCITLQSIDKTGAAPEW